MPELANPPLTEVACEFRFPGHFAVYDGLGSLQAALAEDFPKLLVPVADPGEALALKPYRLASADSSEFVCVAVNLFAFITTKYTVFEKFMDRLDALVRIFRKVHQPDVLSRVGLRYVNKLPWSDASAGRFHPWLNLGLKAPEILRRPIEEIQASFVLKYDHGSVRVAIGRERTPAAPQGATTADNFLLDLDYFTRIATAPRDLISVVRRGHDTLGKAFFDLLTRNGWNAMGGGA